MTTTNLPSVREPSMPLGAEAQGTDGTVVSRGTDDFTIPESGLTLLCPPKRGLPEHADSAWSLCCDDIEAFAPDTLRALNEQLADKPELRESAMLAAMVRARAALAVVDADAATDTECIVSAADLMLLLQSAKKRLR